MGLPSLLPGYLTKSAFLAYQTCPGFAWLKLHQPHLLPEVDAIARQRMRDGIEMDHLARTRYADGFLIDELDMAAAIRETESRLQCPETAVLFQATLAAEPGFLARADILIRDGEGWRLLEVKAACSIDKDHLIDAAFQVATFAAAGMVITRVGILHLDRAYLRNGACDPQLLFTESDCTEAVRAMAVGIWPEMIAAADALADGERPTACECHRNTKPNHCAAFTHFHPEVPEHGSIYKISRLHVSKLNTAVDRGVYRLADWPDDVPLSSSQTRQVHLHRTRQPMVDWAGLEAFMEQLRFPLYFLDYETSQTPAPLFEGCWPYQQVPFQYSLHIVDRDGSCTHHEHLATEIGQSPSGPLAQSLARQIGSTGSIVGWNATFESGCNRDLANAAPELATFFLDLNARMIDLMDTVAKGLYVHPEFNGRASIKVVLPVLVPDLSYKEMAISDGMTASHRWRACQQGEISGQARLQAYAELREYCRLDTLAMVRIWQHLTDLCAEKRAA